MTEITVTNAMDMRHTMYLQRSRNGENRKAGRLKKFDGVNQHPIEQRFPSYKMRQQSVRFWTRHLSHSNIKGTFQLSHCEDRRHPAVTFAKFEYTAITNELVHRLKRSTLCPYPVQLYDALPSTSHMRVSGIWLQTIQSLPD